MNGTRRGKKIMSIPYISVLVNACVNTRNIIIIIWRARKVRNSKKFKKKIQTKPKMVVRGVAGVSSISFRSGGFNRKRKKENSSSTMRYR